jgi:hypothetical protein
MLSPALPLTTDVLYSRLHVLRAFSFDETRLDDKTHGDGANRKGRTERTFRAGKWDEGVCIGQKSASHTASLVGGSNALGEPLPPFVVIASSFEPTIGMLQAGPVAIVNGKQIGTTGTANNKGSVDGEAALMFIDHSVLPMLSAHGPCPHSNPQVAATAVSTSTDTFAVAATTCASMAKHTTTTVPPTPLAQTHAATSPPSPSPSPPVPPLHCCHLLHLHRLHPRRLHTLPPTPSPSSPQAAPAMSTAHCRSGELSCARAQFTVCRMLFTVVLELRVLQGSSRVRDVLLARVMAWVPI